MTGFLWTSFWYVIPLALATVNEFAAYPPSSPGPGFDKTFGGNVNFEAGIMRVDVVKMRRAREGTVGRNWGAWWGRGMSKYALRGFLVLLFRHHGTPEKFRAGLMGGME